jgi:hypothetical protein
VRATVPGRCAVQVALDVANKAETIWLLAVVALGMTQQA